jgi:hypothetical protein
VGTSGDIVKSYFKNVGLGLCLGVLFGMVIGAVQPRKAHGRDVGQWEAGDPAIKEWCRSLMQPDVPTLSCCGEADAYWCDDIHVRDERTFCKITDDRDDTSRNRPHIDVGTEFEIPPNKLKFDKGNPTGHAIIFLSMARYVWCFVQAGGA